MYTTLGDRLMVGHPVLVRRIGVRVPISQLGKVRPSKFILGGFTFPQSEEVQGEKAGRSRAVSRNHDTICAL